MAARNQHIAFLLFLSAVPLCYSFTANFRSSPDIHGFQDQNLSRQRRADMFKDYEQKMLDCHNEHRKVHKVPEMTLSAELNEKATKCATHYAKKGEIDHSCPKNTKGDSGENLFKGDGGDYNQVNPAVMVACDLWYKEVSMYDFEKAKFDKDTGHFTQMVWKESVQLGVGFASKGSEGYVVALYQPPGNIVGQFKDNVFSNVSQERSCRKFIGFAVILSAILNKNLF